MVCTSKQEYRCYGSCGLLYLMADILSEQVSFHAVQQKGEGDDCRERIKRCITCQFIISDHCLLTCTHFIKVQVGRFLYHLNSAALFLVRYFYILK